MPKRPRQHILEEISRDKFKSSLPEQWVYRDKDKDYGIDAEVEIFNDDGLTTGFVFWVQLKATDARTKSTIMNVDLKIDTLKYYKQLEIPVILVRYSSHEDNLYAKWVNNIDLYYSKENSKSCRIKLTEGDLWKAESADAVKQFLMKQRLIKSAGVNFPISLFLDIQSDKVCEFSKGILYAKIRKAISIYSDYINLCRNDNKAVANAIILDNTLNVNISNLGGCTIHNLDLIESDDIGEVLSKEILLGLSLGMITLGQIENAGRIIFENNLQTIIVGRKGLLQSLISPLFKSSYFEKVLDLIDMKLDTCSSDEVELATALNILVNTNLANVSRNRSIENYLINRLNKKVILKESKDIGIAHYNLGNFYRGRNNPQKAIRHYLSARNFTPIYKKQYYYFKELAGCLFMIEKYTFSAHLYHKAIQIGSPNDIKGLYADALMFAGKYQKSLTAFSEYLSENPFPCDEYYLKSLCMENIVNQKKIYSQNRKSEEANEYVNLSKDIRTSSIIENLERALNKDLLCASAWFYLGVHFVNNNNIEAFLCFLMTSLIEGNNIGAWVNTTILSLSQEEPYKIFPIIVKAAYVFNGNKYLEVLYRDIEKQAYRDSAAEIFDMIEQILSKSENPSKNLELRVLNENGLFENVLK